MSAVIFLIHIAFNHSSVVDRVIFFVSALLASCLICLGWIKGMQEMQFYQAIHDTDFPQSGAPTVSPSAS